MKEEEKFGLVVIGRNEGLRLKLCLESVVGFTNNVVYVDSGSTDDSINIAKELNVKIIKLDMSKPFTAARARNEGFQKLIKIEPNLEYVQFVDGDCEVVAGWFDIAVNYLSKYPTFAVVCGRRRERYPDASIYNLLCNIEWNTIPGEVKTCGGDAMYRVKAFISINGFRSNLIAGEEPELCVRLRNSGWRICRLDTEMTLRDANMMHFNQWWKRSIRAGYAFAEGAYLHSSKPEKYRVRESLSIWFWGILFPITIVLLSMHNPWWILLFITYPIQVLRLFMNGHHSLYENIIQAVYIMLGKFPEGIGQIKFIIDRMFRRQNKIIEYK